MKRLQPSGPAGTVAGWFRVDPESSPSGPWSLAPAPHLLFAAGAGLQAAGRPCSPPQHMMPDRLLETESTLAGPQQLGWPRHSGPALSALTLAPGVGKKGFSTKKNQLLPLRIPQHCPPVTPVAPQWNLRSGASLRRPAALGPCLGLGLEREREAW